MPDDYKTAIILSITPLEEKFFTIKDVTNDKEVLIDSVNKLPYKLNSEIKYSALINFTSLKNKEEYFIEYQNVKSYPFQIDDFLYNSKRDSLSLFFKAQRCKPTNTLLHQVCHL